MTGRIIEPEEQLFNEMEFELRHDPEMTDAPADLIPAAVAYAVKKRIGTIRHITDDATKQTSLMFDNKESMLRDAKQWAFRMLKKVNS